MIRILEKTIADKIAAGEVIDRPVSIVKELMENSFDAGADSITCEIREGGKSYIRITDNGCGIDADEVETAFLRHATSKIATEKDLDSIATLGFRGEALASVAAVSRIEMITKTSDAKSGRKVVIEGSRTIENTGTGCPDGTTITVRDLFYNVPARHKFMGTDAAESRRITDLVSRLAVSYPDVKIRLISNSKTVFNTPGKGNILNTIVAVYGADLGRDLVPVEMSEGNLSIKGFVSSPATSMSQRNRQIFCVNGRIISSGVMERALDRAYSERLFTGRFPIAFLFLTMAPDKLDVNIHPTKKEVRFDDNSEVEDFVKEAVTLAITEKEAIPKVKIREEKPEAIQQKKSEQVDIKSILSTFKNEEPKYDFSQPAAKIKEEKVEYAAPDPVEKPIEKPIERPFEISELNVIGTVFNTYILASDEDCFYMLDQHAAHERILYEKFMKQFDNAEKATQTMLIPLNFNVSADVTDSEEMWIDHVRAFGYDIEFFGNNTYIVREVPSFMDMQEAEVFLNEMFFELQEKPDLRKAKTFESIVMNSCKSAVKGGDSLDDAEIRALMAQLEACNNPYSCPHGRPTFVRMTRYDMEKMFKRV